MKGFFYILIITFPFENKRKCGAAGVQEKSELKKTFL
ncbi:MAG: hypothetical protein JWO58_374 [Chitinophagaceae bacterium]|nr:hypothetical protein [Chitinophagaceae bacterium]